MGFSGYGNNSMKYGEDFISISDIGFKKFKRSQRISKRKRRDIRIANAFDNQLINIGVKKKKKKKFIFF